MYFLFLAFLHSILGTTLFYLSWVDWHTRRIPDIGLILLSLVGGGLGYLTNQSFVSHLGAAGLGFVLLFILGSAVTTLKGKKALGFGDVKLFTVLCFFLTPVMLPSFCLWIGAFGLCTKVISQQKEPFPFAPAISLGFIFTFWLKLYF